MHILTLSDVHRFETAFANSSIAYAQCWQRFDATAFSTVLETPTAAAACCGEGHPICRVVRLGIEPLAAADLTRIEEFFRERRCPARAEVSAPLQDNALPVLRAAGYAPGIMVSCMWRPLTRDDTFPAPPEALVVERTGPEHHEAIARLIAQAFSPTGQADDRAVRVPLAGFLNPDGVPFLVRSAAELVAGGSLIVRDGAAILAGGATVAPARGRGAHTALINARLAAARDAGCDVALYQAKAGTTSERNALRAGFRPAYARLVLEKTLTP